LELHGENPRADAALAGLGAKGNIVAIAGGRVIEVHDAWDSDCGLRVGTGAILAEDSIIIN
jgi:hypothetical protein